MAPPTKRARMSASKQPSPSPSLEAESDDEWAAERAGQSSSQQQQRGNGDSDDDEGVAQFMEDEGEEFEDSEEEDEETAIANQISAIPFVSLLKAKKKLSRAAAAEESSSDEEDEPETSAHARSSRKERKPETIGQRAQSMRANGSLRKADRASKHAPMEMSSKRAVGRSRAIVETRADKSRDPRFDSLSGNFKPDLFRTSYSFLSTAQTTELETLRKTAQAARRNPVLPEEDKEKIEAALMRMESREVARRTKEREGDALKEWKKVEEKKREGGKKEFYLKKSDQKAVLLKAKYDTLSKDKKQLRKAVEKKRRKTVQSDKKLMPAKRAGGD